MEASTLDCGALVVCPSGAALSKVSMWCCPQVLLMGLCPGVSTLPGRHSIHNLCSLLCSCCMQCRPNGAHRRQEVGAFRFLSPLC